MSELGKSIRRHPRPIPMFPCRVFDNVRVGYFCVPCFNFVPVSNPEIEMVRNLLKASDLQ